MMYERPRFSDAIHTNLARHVLEYWTSSYASYGLERCIRKQIPVRQGAWRCPGLKCT